MKNTRKPYIYKVTDLETRQYYIGRQCSGKTIGVNYFTSSTNKAFKEGFKNYREEKYKIEIIKEFDDPKKCGRAENYIIRNYMLKKDGLCLNRSHRCCNGERVFSRLGQSPWNKGLKGLPAWNKGIPHSEEEKEKISTALKRKISIEGNVFDSLAEAAKYYNVTRQAISYWSKNKKGHPAPRRIKISIEGTIFESLNKASKYYNKDKETIRRWVKNKKHNAFYVEK